VLEAFIKVTINGGVLSLFVPLMAVGMEGVHFDGFWNLAFLESRVVSCLVLACHKNLKAIVRIEYLLASYCILFYF